MALFLKTLLSLSVSGTVLGLAVMLISHVGKKQLRSGFIYLCWALVFLRFVLPLPGVPGLSLMNSAPDAENSYAANVSAHPTGYYSSPLARTEGTLTWEDATKAAQQTMTAEPPAPEDSAGVTIADTSASSQPSDGLSLSALIGNWNVWFFIWLGGALASVGGTVLSFAHFRRVLFKTLKPAHPLDSSVLSALNASPYPALYRSDKVSTTMLLGLLRPVIILPDREYSSEMLDRMLRHELTHYRRGDLALKWLQMLVVSLHWFNPFVYIFRTQAALYCELSCDNKLIRSMNKDDKQSYGEMLLNLAADRALPRRVIAVSFTTEKRDLKERLVQIMTFKKLGKQALALMIAALIAVCSLGYVMGPARASSLASGGSEDTASDGVRAEYHVSSVNELLQAIGSDRTIYLSPGTYNLSEARDYGWGQAPEYYWEEAAEQEYQLVIDVVDNLTITGEGDNAAVSIVTDPRSAAVIKFNGCANVEISNMTVGHTELPDACQGAVIYLYGCRNVLVDNCVLYGCGTIGIQANECWKLKAVNTVIKECSTGAIELGSCYEAVFDHCEMFGVGARDGYPAHALIETGNGSSIGLYNCDIHDNNVYNFVVTSNTHDFEMLGSSVKNNHFDTGFATWGSPVILAQNEFESNGLAPANWFDADNSFAYDLDGNKIDGSSIGQMRRAEYSYTGRAIAEADKPEGKTSENGMTEYHVSNIDELLACIGSDTVIYLEPGKYEISTAKEYGRRSGSNYYWNECYDGFGIALVGIENMRIVGPADKAFIELYPRSADVLALLFCEGVSLENLVLGHTQGAGSCTGDVVSFMGCGSCSILNSELFGCGVNGVNAFASTGLRVQDSLIYECSGYAAIITDCAGTVFDNVILRDCGNNSILTQRCRVSFSGETYYTEDYNPYDYYADYYGYDEDYEYYGYDYEGPVEGILYFEEEDGTITEIPAADLVPEPMPEGDNY